MKKLLLLACIATSLQLNAQTNTYFPFLDNVAWYYGSSDFAGTFYYWYHVTGDTTIQGNTYKVIENDSAWWPIKLLREDTAQQIVYQYVDTTEYVLYDFTRAVNDTFYLAGTKYVITGIDSINTPLGYRKRWQVITAPPMLWIWSYAVGLGSVGHPMEILSISDPTTGCICSWNKYNQQTYGAMDTTCHANPFYIPNAVKEPDNTLYRNIFPNPVTGRLPIQALPPNSTLRLMDLAGKVVYEETNPQTSFDTQTIPNAVYVYHITDADHRHFTGKVVVQN